MGIFREHPATTAKRELAEEAGILYPEPLFEDMAVDCLSFMKGKLPQPLFSFGFANDLSRFPAYNHLDDITKHESNIKQQLRNGKKPSKEAYHFTIPYSEVEKIAGELSDAKRFYGPIYDSTINFVRALRDSGKL